MTMPKVAQLVIQAGFMGKGGDVLVLDKGELVRITDLAKNLIHLSGLEINYTGRYQNCLHRVRARREIV